MALEFPIATLDALKWRLGRTTTEDDVLLAELLNSVSGAMESFVGRSLRRVHARAETFSGGRDVIRVGVPPIAKVHYIRESETRDFNDSDVYTELVEGEDYVLDCGPDGNTPGENGAIRRVGTSWMGDRSSPGQIRVSYSGGYKTNGEIDAENETTEISAADSIDDFNVSYSLPANYPHTIGSRSDTEIDVINNTGIGGYQRRAIAIFDISDYILPVWQPYYASTSFYAIKDTGSPTGYLYLIDPDDLDNVSSATPEELYDAVTEGSQIASVIMDYLNTRSLLDVYEHIAVVARCVENGKLALGFVNTKTDDSVYQIKSVENATAEHRPKLYISHRPSFDDAITMPHDLKHACMLQASREFQSRGGVGHIMTAQRGVSIASGSSVRQKELDLLPEVQRILARYARVY